MISHVVEPQKRGSFMSFNSSIQQLGTSAASLIAGLIVIKGSKGEIFRYEWLGYISVAVLLGCVLLARKIFQQDVSLTWSLNEKQKAATQVEA